jgi:hypothetical protein
VTGIVTRTATGVLAMRAGLKRKCSTARSVAALKPSWVAPITRADPGRTRPFISTTISTVTWPSTRLSCSMRG